MNMRFGTWNVRYPYRSGFLKMVVRELGKCKLDLVGVQEDRWAEDYTFFCEGNEDQLRTGFSIPKRNLSAVTRAEFFGGKMYIILKRLWPINRFHTVRNEIPPNKG
jgi:hypothetical protein